MFGLGGDGFRENRGVGSRLARFVTAPLRWGWKLLALPLAGLKYVRVGWGGREGRHLWQGLPALAAGLTVLFLWAAAAVRANGLPDRYRRAAEAAREAGDIDLALTLYDRLGRLDAGAGGTGFARGQLLSEAGRDAEAAALMRALTARRPPDPRAHVWLAERLLTGPGVTLRDDLAPVVAETPNAEGKTGDGPGDEPDGESPVGEGRPAGPYKPTPQQAVAAAQHLNAALRTGLNDDPRVHGRLAEILLLFGRRDDAVRHLKAQSAADPSRLLAYAELLGAVGQAADATNAYRRAAAHLTGEVEEAPADWPARRRLALALVRSEQAPRAREVLRRGLRGGSDPAGAAMLSELLVGEVRRLGLLESERALPLLREALGLTPTSRPALAELAKLAAGGDDAADAMLNEMMTSGDASGAVHLAAGLRASARGRSDAALFHYARAYELDPTLAFAANNLAFLLARREDDPQPGRALEIMDGLVDRFPEVANFRDTRGGILMILGRPGEAVKDLEQALAGGMAGNRGLHAALAEAYADLGQDALAEAHRVRVAAIDAGSVGAAGPAGGAGDDSPTVAPDDPAADDGTAAR